MARNILDPNVVPDKKRTVTLKITLKPSEEDQSDVIVSADVTCTLSPEVGATTNLFVSQNYKTGSVTVMEHSRGEIKGQLDFSDVGIGIEEEFDPETGEIIQGDVLNFRQAKEG